MNILIISPWSSFWSMDKGKGTLSEIKLIDVLLQKNHFIFYIRPIGEKTSIKNLEFYEIKNPFTSWYFRYKISKKYKVFAGLLNFFLKFKEWILFNFRVFITAYKIISKNQISLILGFSAYGSFIASLIGKYFKIPCIGKLFGLYDFYTKNPTIKHKIKRFETYLTLKFLPDGIIMDNDGTFGDLVAKQYQISTNKFVFLQNGIDFNWANNTKTKQDIKQNLKIPQDKKVILSVSRLDECKRIDRIIDVVPNVIKYYKNVIFLIVGDGFKREELINQVQKLKIENYVKFIGSVLQTEVENYIKAADLFISLSDITNRTCPVQEALICGLPTIVLNTGSVYEIVKNDYNGKLIEDLNKTHAEILDFLNNDKKRDFLSENAKNFALKNFISWEEKVKIEVDFIEKVVKNAIYS